VFAFYQTGKNPTFVLILSICHKIHTALNVTPNIHTPQAIYGFVPNVPKGSKKSGIVFSKENGCLHDVRRIYDIIVKITIIIPEYAY
jgi:hypothetical protein